MPTTTLPESLDRILARLDATPDQPVPHDLSDPYDRAFLDQLARGGGMTPRRYPALFARLKPAARPGKGGKVAKAVKSLAKTSKAKPAAFNVAAAPTGSRAVAAQDTGGDIDNAFQAAQILDYIGTLKDTPGTATAQATFTWTKPIAQATVWLSVVNRPAPGAPLTVLASGTTSGYLEQTLRVTTNEATAQALPKTGQNAGVLSWSVQYQDGTSETSSQGGYWSFQADGDPVVTAPVQNPARQTGDLTAIVVGLSRGFSNAQNNTDVDYWFWQGAWANITLLVPMAGTMKFQFPISALGPQNPILNFYLAKAEGGVSDLQAANTVQYLSCFSIDTADPTGCTLKFSLLAGTSSAGNAINFGRSIWGTNTRTYFSGRVQVMLNNLTNGWASIMSSDDPDTDPTDGVAKIKPIVYVWHCVVAGTQITMADGTTRAIETLNSGDVVMSGDTTRPVLATLAQPHYGTVYTLTLSSGQSLTCSGTHPVMTPGGVMPASTLQPGQQVATPTGTATVAGVTTSQQNGEGLFNLWLDPANPGDTLMVANGLVVGDYQIQVALPARLARDTAYVRSQLPESLRKDYDSYVADLTATA